MDGTLFRGVALLVFGLVAGCSTVSSRIQENPQIYASLSPAEQAAVQQGGIREGMSKAAVYLAWGRPDRIQFGNRAGTPFEVWIYTTTQTEIVSGYYPTFDGFGYARYGWYRPFFRQRGFYGYYPFHPYLGNDLVYYQVPYKTAYFERDRCTGWEYIR
jgi:hypothetical protein